VLLSKNLQQQQMRNTRDGGGKVGNRQTHFAVGTCVVLDLFSKYDGEHRQEEKGSFESE
jgi:hypothetical protein